MSSDPPVRPAAVRAQAAAMRDTLDTALPGRREELARDPVAVLRTWPEIIYQEVPPAATGGPCSVAGAYYVTEEPPLLTVANTVSPGRRAFTALHELGHHLQQSDLDLAETVDLHGGNAASFEDAACDAFAADVLLPTDVVERHLPAGTPTADDVAALYRGSSASRAAACVRAAQRLTAPGHVLLLDDQGTVHFAASHLLPRPARGSDQHDTAVVAHALASAGRRGHGRTRLRYRDGILGDELYAHVAPIDGYLVLVAVTEAPPWEGQFTLPLAQTGPRGAWRICEQPGCGYEFSSFEAPCRLCGAPACPDCGRCSCTPKVQERQCPACFTVYPLNFFHGDRCDNCS